MGSARAFRLLLALMTTTALLGCVEGQGQGTQDGSATLAPGATRTVDRDVEAPEVFQTSDDGLWDGRPSLGGVWVASSDVKDPERVIIRNDANGKFVVGALFRRERENPGPKLQVSSDAAAALGMLAGAPAKLSVTALKREEAAPAAEPDTAAEVAADAAPTEGLAAAEAIESKPLDTVVAGASEALDRAESGPAPAPAELPAAEPEPRRKGLAGLFQRRKKPAVEAPLDAVSGAPDIPAIAPPVATPAPKAAAPKASKLDKPYVQIGIFSVEENATRTVATLKRAGVAATIRKSSASGKAYWRVLAGPSPTVADRAALLAKVKATGFTDAYVVSG